jgi:hypothetical protein
MQYDLNNEMFRLAAELVNQSSRNIFLTGKAGTGKTTFLKYIRESCPKQIAVVAPTGVAAINAGGVTIHSFFQLPLSPFVPEAKGFENKNDEVINRHSLLSRQRMTNEKKKVLQELELLIIDEISMVRCDTLDAIDTVLRHVRSRHSERFGGVQVLFIGDMYQLPPVIPDREWGLLSVFYKSPYFFDSRVMQEDPTVYVEFNKIYRQSEEKFINLLNQVRNNELDADGLLILDGRLQPAFRRTRQDGYIILTTHNYKADVTNANELKQLGGEMFSFQAEITGEFAEKTYPADELLQLKAGAQVMFIKNDADKNKRYFNGKIGIVTRLGEDEIFVQCKDEPDEIEVKKEAWENIRYSLNKNTRRLEEEVLGSFTQYPLRLAWAITIHKSQGLTFEKAIIDAGEAFAPGQVYVALSRCTSLDGLVLQSRIRPNSLHSDERIVRFSQRNASASQLQQELSASRKNYQQAILRSTFDFASIFADCKEMMESLIEHKTSFNTEAFTWIEQLIDKLSILQETAGKFQQLLQALFQQPGLPEENTALQERIVAGATYFSKQLEPVLQIVQQSPAITDSRLHAKEFNESLKEIFVQLSLKKHLFSGCDEQFNMEAYHRLKNKFLLPTFRVSAYAGAGNNEKTEIQYPALHQQLRKLRDHICSKKDIPIYFVAGSKTLEELTAYLPQTIEELQKISGFGKAKTDAYGQQFLEIIGQYCREHNLSSRIAEKKPKRQRKSDNATASDTKAESFRLYKEGKTISEIAGTRNLTTQTVEGHLAYYVQSGEINIEEMVSSDKIKRIESAIKEFNGGPITPIKEKLGNDISFGEIRLVIAWSSFKRMVEGQ